MYGLCVHGNDITKNCDKCAADIRVPNAKLVSTSYDEKFEGMKDKGKPGWEEEKGGTKFDGDKPRMDLLDTFAIEELARVLTFGAKKYAPNNWRKGIKLSRLSAAAMRHLLAFMGGQDDDEETGLQHAGHLMCCAMFMIWTLHNKPEMDDRWNPEEVK